jgi:putative intracellular protease/amidase
MLSMTPTAHIAVYDTLADWEPGHLLAELRSGRFTGVTYEVRSVAESLEPVVTMGGLRLLPDMVLGDLDPADSDLLILPGSEQWDAGGDTAFAELAERFLESGVPVAAICGATAGLARHGLLDDRRHTSAAAEYLAATGYAGGPRYVEARAVADDGLVTAGPDAPVPFARATLGLLGLLPEPALDAYEGVFQRGDAACLPVLLEAAQRTPAVRR